MGHADGPAPDLTGDRLLPWRMLDALPDHACLVDADGRIRFVNAAWRAFAQRNAMADPGAGLGASYFEACERARDDGAAEAHAVGAALRELLGGGRRSFEHTYPCHSPLEQRWFRLTLRAVDFDGGVAALVLHSDVTSMMQQVVRSEFGFGLNPMPMCVFDATSYELLSVNDAAALAYGIDRDRLPALTLPDLWHEEDRDALRQALGPALAQGTRSPALPRLRWSRQGSRGAERHVDVQVRRIGGWIGRSAGLALLNDVTAEVRADRAIRDSAERMRQLASAVDEVFWLSDLHDGSLLYVSPAYAEIWGDDPLRLAREPRSWQDAVLPEDRDRVAVARERQKEGRHEVEYRIRRPDGSVRWIEDRSFPVVDADGEVRRIAGVARDVTAQRERDARLRLLEAAVARLNDMVLITEAEPFDEPGPRIVYVNDAFERRTGYTREEAIGRSPRMLQGPATQRDELDRIRTALERWQPVRAELINYTKAGDPFWIELDIVPLADASGWYTHWVSVERDISDRKLAEQKLLQTQRLESLGLLTGGVAHDFNNLLTVVIGNAETLTETLDADSRERRMAAMVLQAALRGAELTQRLLAFARRQALAPQVVGLGRLARELAPLLQRAVGDRAELTATCDTAHDRALVDVAQLENALLNLVVNARDAIAQRGHVQVRVHDARLDEAQAAAIDGAAPGDYVCVTVEDDGQGIAPHVLPRIFEPFFTTKRLQSGTGLGLAMVYGFVRQSQGWVGVTSQPGQGTRVSLAFPRCDGDGDDEAQALPAHAPEALVLDGPVLVVDDDPVVREILVSQLQQLGHAVLQAAGAREALALLREHADVSLLLTDVIMPGGLDGAELAREARRLRPGLPVVFATGYSGEALMQDGRLDASAPVLAKPYRKRELERILLEAMRP